MDKGIERQNRLGYWEARRHMIYYKSLFQFICVVADEAQSIIDIGSASAQYMSWLEWIPNRTLLDFNFKSKRAGFHYVEADFLKFQPKETYDVAVCCQVLEHVESPKLFCQALRGVARRLIVTVPYNWLGNAPGHLHDPVDEEKLKAWMQIVPNNQQVVPEPFRESRLIAYYDLENGPSARFDKGKVFEAIARRAQYAP